jgi:colanic acid biosynthesis glycosyl transferase WcaI
MAMTKQVVITTHIFPPEVHPSGVMNNEVAYNLTISGCNVKIITCFPSHPQGILFPGWRRTLTHYSKINGVEVIRAWHPIWPHRNLIYRGLELLGQGLSFLLSSRRIDRVDIVISDGPPLMGSLCSWIIAKKHHSPLLTVVHDFPVDAASDMGLLNNILIRPLLAIELLTYRISHHLIVLSEGFRQTMIRKKGVPEEKVSVIPVWLDNRDIHPANRDNTWRREMGIGPEKFVVLYAGTIGLVSGAEVVIEAAKLLKHHPDILFLLVGAGHAKDRMEAEARDSGLHNLRFLPFQPRERLSEVQATADVSLVTLAPGRGKTSVPSKILGYMAAARPVIAAVDEDCDTAILIKKAACGLVALPGNGKELSEAVIYYYQHPKPRELAGLSGRRYFLKHFEKEIVLKQYVNLVDALTDRHGDKAMEPDNSRSVS